MSLTWKFDHALFISGVVQAGAEIERQVTITSRSGRAFAVTAVLPMDQRIKVDIKRGDSPAASQELTIRIVTPDAPGAFRQSISLESDIEGCAPLVLIVAGVIRGDQVN